LPTHFKWWFAPLTFAILLPLVMVRSVSWFAKLHIFGDFMIFLTICVILGYSGASVKNNGFEDNNALLFNKSLWPNTIGFAIYSFEGIGVILPV
jgi:proton-coupled amino acid transporter